MANRKLSEERKQLLRDMAASFPVMAVVHKSKGGGYWVESPQLGGCFADGDTVSKCLTNFKFAMYDYFDVPKELQRPEAFVMEAVEIPDPTINRKSEPIKFVPTLELAASCA